MSLSSSAISDLNILSDFSSILTASCFFRQTITECRFQNITLLHENSHSSLFEQLTPQTCYFSDSTAIDCEDPLNSISLPIVYANSLSSLTCLNSSFVRCFHSMVYSPPPQRLPMSFRPGLAATSRSSTPSTPNDNCSTPSPAMQISGGDVFTFSYKYCTFSSWVYDRTASGFLFFRSSSLVFFQT